MLRRFDLGRRVAPWIALAVVVGCEDERPVAQPPPVIANRAPVVTIVAPMDGARLGDPSNVRFAGIAEDPEDGPLPPDWMSWTSDVDGVLGNGPELFRSLSIGRHRITFIAKDSAGFMGAAQVEVIVATSENMPPVATIDAPLEGAVVTEGQSVMLSGRAMDLEDGELSGAALFWSSSIDGSLGLGNAVLVAQPSLGEHVILLTAIDSAGEQGLASVRVTVAAVGANVPPRVTITSPMSGAAFTTGDPVMMLGEANDPEEGVLTGAKLEWRSSVHGSLGTGASVSRNDLGSGVHTLTLTATDTEGASGRDSVVISINAPGNTAPMATISEPMSGATVFANQMVTFVGAATDAEDGALGDAQLEWRSSADGVLGTGLRLVVATLSVGAHDVTLVATDSGGSVGTAQVSLTVLAPNMPPVVTITAPADGSMSTAGDMINFVGVASDPEDGALGGMALVWQSSLDGPMGTGSPLSFSSLTEGLHTVTLTAVDSGGLPASASIDVRVEAAQVNLPPIASVTGPVMGAINSALTFDASGSRDPDGTIVTYAFDWGDGTAPSTGGADTGSHSFSTVGTFTVTLTVTDDDGATGTDSFDIDVFVPVPVPEVIVDAADQLGTRCDLALDGMDRPHVVYLNNTHRQLWYASWDGAAWTTSLVDGPGFDVGGVVDDRFALAVTGAGVPHVAYRADGEVRYATPNGAGWTREAASSSFPETLDRPIAIALDPANGDRPTIAWSHYDGSSTVAPVVSHRAAAGSWTEQRQSTTSTRDYFLGGLVFDSAGNAWLTWDERNPSVVKWTAAGGFVDADVARTTLTVGNYVPLVLDGSNQPIMVTSNRTFHRVGGMWLDSSYHYSSTGAHDAAINASGAFAIGLRHGNGIELAQPTPYWQYEYQGPMDGTAFGIGVDSAGLVRACFFRSGNLLVF